MAVIIDNDVIHRVMGVSPKDPKLSNWLFNKHSARLAYGGELKSEILKHKKYEENLAKLKTAGKIIDVPSADIRSEKNKFECKSDDPDIIAIVRIKGIRLVSTKDNDLKTDLRSKRLTIPERRRCKRPTCKAYCRVKIYNEIKGDELLSKYGGCESIA